MWVDVKIKPFGQVVNEHPFLISTKADVSSVFSKILITALSLIDCLLIAYMLDFKTLVQRSTPVAATLDILKYSVKLSFS